MWNIKRNKSQNRVKQFVFIFSCIVAFFFFFFFSPFALNARFVRSYRCDEYRLEYSEIQYLLATRFILWHVQGRFGPMELSARARTHTWTTLETQSQREMLQPTQDEEREKKRETRWQHPSEILTIASKRLPIACDFIQLNGLVSSNKSFVHKSIKFSLFFFLAIQLLHMQISLNETIKKVLHENGNFNHFLGDKQQTNRWPWLFCIVQFVSN